MKVTFSFSLDTEQDRKTLKWLEGLPKGTRSKAIRDALEAGLEHTPITLGDIYQEIKVLGRTLRGRAFVIAANAQEDGGALYEPPDAAATLDKLGL